VSGVPQGSNEATLLNVEERESLPAEVLSGMQEALAASLHEIYFFVVAIAVAMFGVVLFFPRGRAQDLAVGEADAAGMRGPAPDESPSVRPPAPIPGEGG
jgi:hypothetical protein